jgi:hypothetical protein
MGEDVAGSKSGAADDDGVRALPELAPWRQVGWIFRDGDSIAIERQGDELRTRVLAE